MGEAKRKHYPPFAAELVAAARASDQTVFEDSNQLPRDDGAVFVTAVPDAPLQVLGRLGRDGRWYIGSFCVVPLDKPADDTASLADAMPARMIVLRDEPVAEAMIKFELSKMMGKTVGGNVAADMIDVLLARLALPCNARFRAK